MATAPPAARPRRSPGRRQARRVHRDLLAAARDPEPQPRHPRLSTAGCGHSTSLPRLGDYSVRELTPKRLTRFRAELEKSGVGTATIVKAMTIVQSILSLRRQRGARRVQRRGRRHQAPLRARARAAHLPSGGRRSDPRQARRPPRPHPRLDPRLLRAPARGGRLPPHLERRRRTGDPLRRHQAPPDPAHAAAEAPRRRPQRVVPRVRPADRQSPVFPAHDGGFWNADDWRNWRRRTWQGEPERQRRDRKSPNPARPGAAPKGTRPRDLRSSYVTLRIYEGIPLTQIAREVGTSVRMIELHYAGVIANWDGKQRPAEASIRAARKASIRASRQTGGRNVDGKANVD